MKILIVDDHDVIHQGLRQMLSGEFSEVEFGNAMNCQDALQLIRFERWDVVLLDLHLPGRGGLDLLRQIAEEAATLPVLIFSSYPEEQFAIRVLKSGASGYLSKSSNGAQICEAIRTVTHGGRYLSLAVTQQIATMFGNTQTELPHEVLSNREFQVMRMIASGRSPTEIADTLALSIKTVSTYRARILEKLNLKTTSEMIRYGIKQGLDS